ncbi:MAG: ATP-binding protein [Bacteroidota bacterium]
MLLIACNESQLQNDQINNINPNQGHFFTVPINLEGYTVHPLTGDSIETPEYLLRGLPFEGNKIKVDENKLARYSLKKIYEQPLSTPKQSEIITNSFPYVPGEKYPFEVVQGKTSEKQFIQMNGKDSIFSGTFFTLLGRELDIKHPEPIKAERSYWEKTRARQITHWQNLQGLQSNYLWHVLEDKNGSIWVGTEGDGISRFDGEYFHNYGVENGLTTGLVMRMAKDRLDNIWMSTFDAGFLKYDGSKFFAYDTAAGFCESVVETIYEDRQGNIWVGGDEFLSRMTNDSLFVFSEAEGYTDKSASTIFQDKNDNIWLGGFKGITRYDGQNFHYYALTGLDEPLKVFTGFMDKYGILWFSIWNNGLLKFNGENFEHITTEQGLVSNYISQIVEDQNGKLWFSSFEGLCSFDGKKFEHITEESGLTNKGLFGLGLTRDNSILIGQNGGGLGLLKQRGIQHLSTSEGLFSNDASTRVEYKDITYHGAFGDGITVQKSNKLENYTTDEGLMTDFIRSLAVGQKELLYVGAQASGFGIFDETSYRHFSIDDESYDVITSVIFMDSKERLWLGLSENGTGYIEGGEFVSINTQNGLVSDRIYGINEDSRGNIWLHSPEGLSKYDGKSLTNFTQREGLVQDYILHVDEDKNGFIWISSRNYLARMDDTQLNYLVDMRDDLMELGGLMAFSENQIWLGRKDIKRLILHGGSAQVLTMSNYSGLKNQEFSLFTKSRDGSLHAGDVNGYDIIEPKKFKELVSPPLLQISHININGVFQDFTKSSELQFPHYSNIPSNLKLSPDQTHVTIHFAANQWAAHDQIEYSYYMDGVDQYWSEVSKEAKVDYRNLPYGMQNFKVKARGESDTWSKPIVFQFYIQPPWYLTASAKVGYVIVAILCIIGIVKLRTLQLKQKQKQLELEIKGATKEITAQRDRAERSERYKEEFLAHMSHEIRTPIHAVSGMLKILKRNSHPESQDKFLDAMTKSTDNLSKLLNDVLDLSKIESGKLQLSEVPFDLEETIANCIGLLKERAEEKELIIVHHYDEGLPKKFTGDDLRISQILINLIGNAIKFSEKGVITVSVQQVASGVQFSVSDNGVGIEKADQKRIFGSFDQVKGKQSYQGTGLGLTITKQLIELQQGEISVSSELGKGSNFYFTLPLRLYDGELSETGKSENELKKLGKGLIDLKILIAEDTEFNVMVVTDDINWYFPQPSIDVAQNGKEALDLFTTRNYDLILMDVQMPEMDGYESTREIRKLEKQKKMQRIPVIAMTASLLEKDIKKCYVNGMDDYIPKPYKASELVLKIVEKVSA